MTVVTFGSRICSQHLLGTPSASTKEVGVIKTIEVNPPKQKRTSNPLYLATEDPRGP